jgi:hypothetical protein
MQQKHTRMSDKHQVSFDSIEIIELPMSLGDNPSVSKGAPVTVEWVAQKRTTFSIDFFEKNRPNRRSRRGLILSAEAREGILLHHGFCLEDIRIASWEVEAAKARRRESKRRKVCSSSSQEDIGDHRLRILESRQRQALRRIKKINQLLLLIDLEKENAFVLLPRPPPLLY